MPSASEFLNQYLDQYYPTLTSWPLESDSALERYRARQVPYLRFPLQYLFRRDQVFLERVIIPALQLSLNTDDSAFSSHASQHRNSRDALTHLVSQLRQQPETVKSRVSKTQLRSDTRNDLVERVVFLSSLESIPVTTKPFLYLAEQAEEYLSTLSNEFVRGVELRKILKKVARAMGEDMAMLLGLCLNIQIQELIHIFDSDANSELVNEFSISAADVPILNTLRAILYQFDQDEVDVRHQTLDRAIRAARDYPNWSHLAPEAAWSPQKYPYAAEYKAVFMGASDVASYTKLKHNLHLDHPERQAYLDTLMNQYTTQVLTMFRKLSVVSDSNLFQGNSLSLFLRELTGDR